VRTIRPIEAYSASIHARGVAAGEKAASCSACHTGHSVLPAADPASSVHRANIPSTCGRCHTEISSLFVQSIHGRAAAAGVGDAPVCNDCHGEHRILAVGAPGSPVSASNLPSRTCGPCHADLRLSERYGLPADQVPAYEDSFHGLAARAGVQRVANCASCHGVHLILPSSDPRSDVHPDRLAQTCGRCHPGAGSRFAIGPVHVLAATTPNVVARWIRAIYVPLIWVVVGGMLLHNALDFVKKARVPRLHRLPPAGTYRVLERMSLGFRIAHGMVMASFVALVVTGFALQYPESWWAALFRLGGAETELRATVHRIAALALLMALGFHLSHLLVSRRARRQIAAMRPGLADFREAGERVGYNLGLRADPPRPVRVGYIEKLEYWAFMWGTAIMTISGLVLWLENLTLAWLPGWVPEAATALHLYEAILATAAVTVWHLYWVIFDPVVYPMDPAWLSGRPGYERALERGEIVSGDGEGDGSA
jgi:cytochrome b subunit of formate dehydrogenase